MVLEKLQNIGASTITQVIITIALVAIISGIHFFKKKKKWDNKYLLLMITTVLTSGVIYAGLMWILKPFGVLTDTTIYDSVIYNLLIGVVLIIGAIVTLKDGINKD